LFDFSGDEVDNIPDGMGLWLGKTDNESNISQELWMFSSGGIYYISDKTQPRYVPENLPSYDQAKEIAENFIQNIVVHGLAPSQVQIKFASVNPGGWTARGNENIVLYLSVRFELGFNGLRIMGPGGKVSVLVGDNGAVVGFIGFWRDVVQDSNASVTVTPDGALEDLKAGLRNVDATVENIALGYYSTSIIERQVNLQPAYVFQLLENQSRTMLVEAVSANSENPDVTPPKL
jgi:hypothetical protein